MKYMKTLICLVIVLALSLALSVTGYAAGATIDTSKTGSMDIYKYDLTSAEAAGAWDTGAHVSSGVYDSTVNDTLGGAVNYAIQGVQFTYLRVADISTYSAAEDDGYKTETVYGLPSGAGAIQLLSALGLSYDNAHHQAESVYYFASDTLITALEKSLSSNATTTKNALESYIASNGGVTMPATDDHGHTSASDLPLGLYLVVETGVPEMVTSTTDPFLVSLPMTAIDGSGWNYNLTLYPKNNTGSPNLEKTVREAQTSTGTNSGSTNITDGYAHAATASDGDVMQYQIVSTLPTITSSASYLTTYTYVDTLSHGIGYNKDDVVIEFFRDAACTDKITSWTQTEGKYTVTYADQDNDSTMTIAMTSAGLNEINTSADVYGVDGSQRGYSGCTMRITYAATVHSDASVVYGDTGNPNTVVLTWKRTNTEYFDTLRDDCHVYTYGMDLAKQFSDGAGEYAAAQFVLHNDTDNYFVQASLVDGVYYVTGHVTEQAQGTVFTPTAEGKIVVKGLENDSYSWTETATADGYVLLKEPVKVEITTAEGGTCDVCHKALLTASATVNGGAAEMTADGESVHALVPLTVVNTKGFDLPQTGSNGTWMFTVAGILLMAGAAAVIFLIVRRKSGHR